MPGVTGSVLATAVHGRSLTTCIVSQVYRVHYMPYRRAV